MTVDEIVDELLRWAAEEDRLAGGYRTEGRSHMAMLHGGRASAFERAARLVRVELNGRLEPPWWDRPKVLPAAPC